MISTDSAGQIAKAVKREGMEEECPVQVAERIHRLARELARRRPAVGELALHRRAVGAVLRRRRLPSAIDEETSNIIASLERRQKDLVDFQIPRLRTCTGPLTLQRQYTAEIRDDLDVFARQLEVRLPYVLHSHQHG